MDVIKWFLPNPKMSQPMNLFLDGFSNVLQKLPNYHVDFMHFNALVSPLTQITSSPNAISIVSNYEALYLESFYEFYPLFKLRFTDINGLILIHKESETNRLLDLKEKQVLFHYNTDWFLINPIILFLIKNCKIDNSLKSVYSISLGTLNLSDLKNKNIGAVVATTFEYNILPEIEKKDIRILGEFPLMPEYVVVAGPKFKSRNLDILKNETKKWLATESDHFSRMGLRVAPDIEKRDGMILMEAIEGLGYNLKEFVEEYPNLLLNMTINNQSYQLKLMNEKYERLGSFNKKLVALYREVRDSHDRLSKLIESASDYSIMFLKDGTILGLSRSFASMIKQNRQDVIGKDISTFLETDMNTPFKSLIQQIDYGLIRSFNVKIKQADSNIIETKMEFSVIELLDSKVILGIFSKHF